MWKCPECGRIFEKAKQPHSCHRIPLEEHFKGKVKARELFDYLIKQIDLTIGKCQIISLPCCIHLFGVYDFLAALPKKDRLEIRFALDRKLDSSHLKQYVLLSAGIYKNCIDIETTEDINEELLQWISQAYHLKDKK
jgi:hypothetical protein